MRFDEILLARVVAIVHCEKYGLRAFFTHYFGSYIATCVTTRVNLKRVTKFFRYSCDFSARLKGPSNNSQSLWAA